MQRKVSTQLDEALFRRLKLEAIRQRRPIQGVVAEALARYLDDRGTPQGTSGAVSASWGALRLPADEVEQILRDEDDFLGA